MSLLEHSRIDLQHLFEHGYTTTMINPETADCLLWFLRRSEWKVPAPQVIDPQYPDVAAWTHRDPPALIEAFWKTLADHPYMSFFVMNHGPFSMLRMSAHRWSKENGLNHHQDYHESLPVNNILYLSGDEWDDQNGGELEIGRWKIDSNGYGDQKTAEVHAKIFPVHGTLVTLLNTSPLYCHAVKPMVTEKEKYSLICRYGYKENYEKAMLNGRM